MPLIAVEGDESDHVGGALIAAGASSPQKVKIAGLNVIVHPSPAEPDMIHPTPLTDTASGSSKVFIYGQPVHRDGDLRICGAVTVASGNMKVITG
jgi:uncharacterized Zn-binding protein involved in type VI secretion